MGLGTREEAGWMGSRLQHRQVTDSLVRDPGIAFQFDLLPPTTSQELL